MPELPYLTTPQVAAKLGISRQRVAQIAKARGIKPAAVVGNTRMWHRRDVPKLRRQPPGRPRKGASDAK